MSQLVQTAGAVLVLTGFLLAQRGLVGPSSRSYLTLNLVGSAVLAVDAAHGRQWGFLLLEGVWAVVSAAGLVRSVRQRRCPEHDSVTNGTAGVPRSPEGSDAA